MFKRIAFLAIIVSLLVASVSMTPAQAERQDAPAQSVILLIGDGMGISQTRLGELYAQSMGIDGLVLSTIDQVALTTTYSADAEVTDSSSAGTAIHGGYKINNGVLNILPDGRTVYTIGQAAHDAGMSVGVVSTTRITHATPASVFAHNESRDNENQIADEMVAFAPEVALAGGWRHFVPASADGTKREDERDLIAEMITAGYTNVTNAEELLAVDTEATTHLLGLFTKSHMAYEVDRVAQELAQPSLADMTTAAIAVLDNNPEGFFLMVEGGRIDHASHAHDGIGVAMDVIAFDEAVAIALAYQAEHPEVLVIVTSDHETGGLSLGVNEGYFTNIPALAAFSCSMEDTISRFTAADAVDGAANCGFALTEEQTVLLNQNPAETLANEVGTNPDPYATYTWGIYVLSDVESQIAGLGWTTWSHTAQPVLTYAVGPSADTLPAYMDNTDIARMMASALGLTLQEPY